MLSVCYAVVSNWITIAADEELWYLALLLLLVVWRVARNENFLKLCVERANIEGITISPH
jgi:hypothetical protein